MSLKGEIAKANVFFTIGRVTSAVIAFLFSIILARMLQPYNFGLYSFCLVVATFFILFADFGMNSTMVRFVASYIGSGRYGKSSTLVKLVFKYKITLTIVIGLLISVLSSQIATFIFNKPEAGFVVFFSGLLLIANSLLNFFCHLFQGLKNFLASSVVQVLQYALKFVFVLALVVMGMGVSGALTGLIISYIVVVIISSIIIYKKYNFIISEQKVELDSRILLTFTFWVFLGTTIGVIYGMIDQLMISNMLTIENVGFYRIALTWVSAITTLVPVTNLVLYPYFSGLSGKKKLNLMFFDSLRYAAIFAFPLAFLLSAYSGPFILFLYKEPFLPAASALSILAFASVLTILYGIVGSYFAGIKRPDITTKVISFTIILNVVLNYFLIQSYGITGAATATFISSFANFVIFFSIAVLIHKMMLKSAIILKPLIAAGIAYYVSTFFLPHVINYFTLAFYGILSLVIYLIIMLLIRGITRQDIDYFKKGLNMILQRL
jgi:O-antigen/teichoic acid export membrane protein